MCSKYIVIKDKNIPLPSRVSLVEDAWGEDISISFVQDNEVLNDASYLDLKVNKWESNSKWSERQDHEPWIRIEIFRDERIGEFERENEFRVSFDHENYFLITLEIDEEFQKIDQVMLARLVKELVESQEVYAYDDEKGYVNCSNSLESLPSKEDVRKSIYLNG